MKSASSSLSFAFATAEAGSEYLTTAEHYQYLARGIVDALRRRGLVLVTNEPPPSLAMLCEALRKIAAPQRVIEISCSPELDRDHLLGDGSADLEAPTPGAAAGEEPGRAVLSSPILVFADADRLSDVQIKDIFEAVQAVPTDPHALEAGVLLAHPAFLARFESPELHPLEGALAAKLCVQQLERHEVEAFIRYQLPPGEGADLFTPRRVGLIALTSGGDPALVNRLARRMLELEPEGSAGGLLAKLSQSGRRRARKPAGDESIAWPGATVTNDNIAPPSAPPRRYSMSFKLWAAIVIGLGALWLIAGEFGSQDVGALVSLVRSHIFPRNEAADVPAYVAATPTPVAAQDSSSATVAAPSSAPPPREAASEPIAPSAARPGVAPSAQPAPQPTPQPAPAEPHLSASEIAALVARGDAFLEAGDVASARLFFERAAEAGDGRAAMRMAVTYDSAFLDRAGLRGVSGDPEQASFWYRRARDLGGTKADREVHGPETSPSNTLPPR